MVASNDHVCALWSDNNVGHEGVMILDVLRARSSPRGHLAAICADVRSISITGCDFREVGDHVLAAIAASTSVRVLALKGSVCT